MTVFAHRFEAGHALAKKLQEVSLCPMHNLYFTRPIVLGLPRGGVPVAYPIADILKCPLDVVVVRKLGVPWHREVAMGAMAYCGGEVITEWIPEVFDQVSPVQREAIYQRELKELLNRTKLFRGDRVPLMLEEYSCAVVVDDGMATGATMSAALRALHKQWPNMHIVCVVPVATRQAIERCKKSGADQIICPQVPELFWGVGGFYQNFDQVDDEEVSRLLDKAQKWL